MAVVGSPQGGRRLLAAEVGAEEGVEEIWLALTAAGEEGRLSWRPPVGGWLKGGGATDEGCDGQASPLPTRLGVSRVTPWGHHCTDRSGGTFDRCVDRQTFQF